MSVLRHASGEKGIFTDGDWILSENMEATGSIGVIQLKHVGNGDFIYKDFSFISEKTFVELGCTEVLPGDVLISRMADPIARACIVPNLPFRCVTAVDVSILRVDEAIAYAPYIQFLCNSNIVKRQAETVGRGTTRLRITRTELGEIEVPLPDVSEQKRIAAILQKADRLRRQRRYALQLSETFVQSVFLKMFGDLQRNQNNWDFQSLGDVSYIASGVTKGQKFNGKKTVTVPYLRVANVQDGYLDLSEIRFIEALESDAKALSLKKSDILMTEGGDFDKLGRGAIWSGQIENCIHQNHIFRVRVNNQFLLPNFFAALLLTPYSKSYFLRCSKQTTNLATINMTQLREMPVPLIPMKLQKNFVDTVHRFERLRAQQREAERQAEHLFQTLLHRAFRGEL